MSLLEQIQSAGVVGCGGAGFPTHVKLNCRPEYYIINAAECEPLLRTDRWLMKHKAAEIVAAAELAADEVKATKRFIALKETYTDEIASLTAALKAANSSFSLYLMKNFYPAGDEQAMVCDITKKSVPPAGIPLDVGAVVSNLATIYTIGEAAKEIPFTQKYLTVTGEVPHPTVLCVPLGTPLTECIRAAGGSLVADYRVVVGGPLMGKLYTPEEAALLSVTKTTSGVLILPADIQLVTAQETPLHSILRRAKTSCIQCSRCTDLCPRYLSGHPLEPHKVMRKLAYSADMTEGLENDTALRNAALCSECGICTAYACPMGLDPRRVNQYVKAQLAQKGIRYAKTGDAVQPLPERDERRVPSKRIAARLGVDKYYNYKIDDCQTLCPEIVRLSLRQHIGAPCVPTVQAGDSVVCGQLIGDIKDNALGAKLHASIAGVVLSVDNEIVIERRDS